MTNLVASHRRSEQGFTLVELAIVMVIIGLLIGGILKGQELISTAKVGATVSQLKALDAAINTFQEKYAAYPGDMQNAGTRLPGCTTIGANCTTDGDGNSLIINGSPTGLAGGPGAASAATAEGTRMFVHLSAGDLLSGIDPAATTSNSFGAALPTVKAGGGMWVGYSTQAAPVAGVALIPGRHYAALSGQATSLTAGATGGFNSITAAQIDRKMDDGVANRGGAQTVGTGCAAAGVYQEATPGGACSMLIRILN